MQDNERILVLAPHTDDGELGCGATLAKYVAAGKAVTYVAFSTCQQSLPAGLPDNTLELECRKATQYLGLHETIFLHFEVRHFPAQRQAILEALVKLNKSLGPSTVFLPAKNDVHQDHHVVYQEGVRAFKYATLLGYELPWNNTQFAPTYFETVTEEQVSLKANALAYYRSQAHRHYMKAEFIRSLATVRGVQCNAPLAEAFEIYRMIK